MAMLVITKWYPIFKASTVSFILPQPSSEGSGGQENDALWQKHTSSALKKMPKLDKIGHMCVLLCLVIIAQYKLIFHIDCTLFDPCSFSGYLSVSFSGIINGSLNLQLLKSK